MSYRASVEEIFVNIGDARQAAVAEIFWLKTALHQCRAELLSIHTQHGDKNHAAEMSAGIRMANNALKDVEQSVVSKLTGKEHTNE